MKLKNIKFGSLGQLFLEHRRLKLIIDGWNDSQVHVLENNFNQSLYLSYCVGSGNSKYQSWLSNASLGSYHHGYYDNPPDSLIYVNLKNNLVNVIMCKRMAKKILKLFWFPQVIDLERFVCFVQNGSFGKLRLFHL